LREHVVPGKSEDESEQVSKFPKNKAYSRPGRVRMGSEIEAGLNRAAFRIEIEKCEKCGGKVKVIACIQDPEVIEKILKHLALDEASQIRNRSPPTGLFGHSGQLF